MNEVFTGSTEGAFVPLSIYSGGTSEKERMKNFLFSLETENSGPLEEIREYAEKRNIPIVRKETESLLKTLIAARNPSGILELGTAVGYSAISMALVCGARITTVELSPRLAGEAEVNFKKAGVAGRVELIRGDASDVLKDLCGEGMEAAIPVTKSPEGRGGRSPEKTDVRPVKFDFIFLDAAKGQYLAWLPYILKLMEKGSVLVADNVLQEESVLQSRYLLKHRARSTHERMREFLYTIKHSGNLVSSVIPVGDGVSVSVMV